jgi:hypothetical protein
MLRQSGSAKELDRVKVAEIRVKNRIRSDFVSLYPNCSALRFNHHESCTNSLAISNFPERTSHAMFHHTSRRALAPASRQR